MVLVVVPDYHASERMNRIVLATHNRNKVVEMKEMLGDIGLEILTVEQFPGVGEIEETGTTLEENALLKARTVHRISGVTALADDTGLEVGYLNNAPGVYSSRYAGEGATYALNCRKLLAAMQGVPERRRGARFRCVLALVGDGKEEIVEGVVHGSIVEVQRGTNGFGYDPVFMPRESTRTMAQMDTPTKNRISHRGRAIRLMRDLLRARMAGATDKT